MFEVVKNFFKEAIQPELVVNYFSRTLQMAAQPTTHPNSDANMAWCLFKLP